MYLTRSWLFLTAVTLFIAACSQGTPPSNSPRNTANAASPAKTQAPSPVDEAAMAKELYVTHCMICHRDNGKGGKVTVEGKTMNPEDLTKDKFKNATDDKLRGYVADGVEDEGMPSFKDKLTAAQIKAVISHVRTLQQ